MICLFSQDPERQITDPDICRLCDCEAEGTVDEGMCDESTSEELGTQAGQCHCKTYVGGPRCDHCAPGETIPNFAVNLYLSLVGSILFGKVLRVVKGGNISEKPIIQNCLFPQATGTSLLRILTVVSSARVAPWALWIMAGAAMSRRESAPASPTWRGSGTVTSVCLSTTGCLSLTLTAARLVTATPGAPTTTSATW